MFWERQLFLILPSSRQGPSLHVIFQRQICIFDIHVHVAWDQGNKLSVRETNGIMILSGFQKKSHNEVMFFTQFTNNFSFFFIREESCGYQLWKYILALDNWKKSLLYTCLSIVCYLHPKEFWQALISGVLLDFTALLYLIRTFRTRNASEPYKYKQLEVR